MFDFESSHTFDPSKKITKIECILGKNEQKIRQINFYHHEERLAKVGLLDGDLKMRAGRREVFEIADDEQLIGCDLDYCKNRLRGVTWMKWKISN